MSITAPARSARYSGAGKTGKRSVCPRFTKTGDRRNVFRFTAVTCAAYNPTMRLLLLFVLALSAAGQDATVLKPARVFDGETLHEAWAVRVRGDRIEAAGPAAENHTSPGPQTTTNK